MNRRIRDLLDKGRESREAQESREAFLWVRFLELVSVERTEPFVEDLRLPISDGKFVEIQRLARACLEAYMFPCLARPPDEEFEWEFPKYWTLYRAVGGVLSEDELQRYSNDFARASASEVLRAVWAQHEDWIGPDTTEALNKWFSDKFEKATLSPWRPWSSALFRVLKDHADGVPFSTPAPIEAESEWRSVNQFCEAFGESSRSLGILFDRLEAEAITQGPTSWEAALQTFPVDSYAGHLYSWLRDIEKCLVLYAFRERWQRLSDALGESVAQRFAIWAYDVAEEYVNRFLRENSKHPR